MLGTPIELGARQENHRGQLPAAREALQTNNHAEKRIRIMSANVSKCLRSLGLVAISSRGVRSEGTARAKLLPPWLP